MDMFILFPHDILLSHNHGYDESAAVGFFDGSGLSLDLIVHVYAGSGFENGT